VYMLHPAGSDLQTPNRKIILKWVGPYMIYSILSDSSCMIQNLDGLIISTVISTKRLKKALIRTNKGKLLRTRTKLKANNNPYSEKLKKKLTEELWVGSPEGAEFFSTIRHRSDHSPPKTGNIFPNTKEFPNTTFMVAKAQFKDGELLAIAIDPETGNSIHINLCDTIAGIDIAEKLLCDQKDIRIEGSPHLGKLNPKWQTTPSLFVQE
jgi:hypothetical protein